MVVVRKHTHRSGKDWKTAASLWVFYLLLVIISALAAWFTAPYLSLTGWN